MMDYPGVPRATPSWSEALLAERRQTQRLLSECLLPFSNTESNCCIRTESLIELFQPVYVFGKWPYNRLSGNLVRSGFRSVEDCRCGGDQHPHCVDDEFTDRASTRLERASEQARNNFARNLCRVGVEVKE